MYDAMNLLIAAVHRAGLNRARIRDAIRTLSPWTGVTGTITWDPSGANQARVGMGTIRRGQVAPPELRPVGQCSHVWEDDENFLTSVQPPKTERSWKRLAARMYEFPGNGTFHTACKVQDDMGDEGLWTGEIEVE